MYVQVMVFVVPAVHVPDPAFGEVTIMLGGGGPVIVKVPSLMSVYELFVVLVAFI